MAYEYTIINGQRVEVHVASAFYRMAGAFKADTGCDLFVSSGTRTRDEQAYLYNGWIRRLPGFNLAAPPGSSNHEEDGPSGPRSIDIADSGAGAGVTTRGTARDGWMERNAGRFGFENEGYNFRPVEAWHKTFRGPLSGGVDLASSDAKQLPKPEPERGHDMETFRRQANNAAYNVIPGVMIKHVPSANEERLTNYTTKGYATYPGLSDPDLKVMLYALGFPELHGNVKKLPVNGGYYYRKV